MFKIGEFARMGQVSVRTLHHYEDIGLLKPLQIDRFTGYRYYSTSQLPRLNRIVALKGVGLSLEEIGQLLDADLVPAQLKTLLQSKQAEFRRQLKETETYLSRLETWLKQLESGENEMNATSEYEITLKKVEPILVASLRQTIPPYGLLHGPFGVLRSYLSQFGFTRSKPSMVLWHFNPAQNDEQGYEVEVAEQLDETVPDDAQIKVYSLPQIEFAASVVHHGDFETAYQAYQALGSWVEAQGYEVRGPTRQIHHVFSPGQDPTTFVTEFQLPVTKGAT